MVRDLTDVIAAEFGDRAFGTVLFLGHEPSALLAGIGPKARRVVGLSDSRHEVQRARALLHGRGLSHCVLQHGDLESIPLPGVSFDAVILDRVLADHARPQSLLLESVRMLEPQGRMIVIEDYDALSERVPGENPIKAVRDWIAESGLICVRLRPVDVGGRHWLMATAAAEQGAEAAA
jgi:ArsR family transcriptional regulator